MNNSMKVTQFCLNEKIIYGRTKKCASTTIDNYVIRSNGRLKRHHYRGQTGSVLGPDLEHLYQSWDGWFSFTFVRNPWDRVVSLHTFFRRRINRPFDEFVLDLDSYFEDHNVISDHALPCHFFTHHKDEQMIDFIGRFENFEEDARKVMKEIRREDAWIPVMNASEHEHYRNYYTEETAQKVADFYSEDIRLLGYEF